MANQKKLPRVLERTEVKILFETFNLRSWCGLRNRVVFETLYRTGLRVSELCALQLGYINFDKRLVTVHEGKGKKDRVVPYDGELAYWIQRWMERRPECVQGKKSSFFFCQITTGRQGQPLCQQYLDCLIKRKAANAAIHCATVSCHVFRHTYASELLEEGFSIREVQELLGHSSVQTTMVYTHVNPLHLATKINHRNGNSEQREQQVKQVEQIIADAQQTLTRLKAAQ